MEDHSKKHQCGIVQPLGEQGGTLEMKGKPLETQGEPQEDREEEEEIYIWSSRLGRIKMDDRHSGNGRNSQGEPTRVAGSSQGLSRCQ